MGRRLGFYSLRGAVVGDDGGSSVGGVGSCGCTSWRLAILLLFCGREEVFCFPMGFLSWAMVMATVWIGWWEKSSEEDCLDALSPLSVALSSGDFELLAVLVASSPKFLGVEMAGCHQFLLVRSVDLRHVDDFGVLLGEAVKNFVSSSSWALASSCSLDGFIFQPLGWRWIVAGRLLAPVTKTTGRPLGGPKCISFFFQGCVCKSCNVNLHM